MQVIFSRVVADELSNKYTVLELETFTVQDTLLEAFCVIPADKLDLRDLPHLADHIKMHKEFISQLKDKNYKFCSDAIEHLMGKFGGELDSFYEIILARAKQELDAAAS